MRLIWERISYLAQPWVLALLLMMMLLAMGSLPLYREIYGFQRNIYPYIRERNISEKIKTLSLLGKKSFVSYREINANNILFNPKVDESKIVKFIEPKKKLMAPMQK